MRNFLLRSSPQISQPVPDIVIGTISIDVGWNFLQLSWHYLRIFIIILHDRLPSIVFFPSAYRVCLYSHVYVCSGVSNIFQHIPRTGLKWKICLSPCCLSYRKQHHLMMEGWISMQNWISYFCIALQALKHIGRGKCGRLLMLTCVQILPFTATGAVLSDFCNWICSILM